MAEVTTGGLSSPIHTTDLAKKKRSSPESHSFWNLSQIETTRPRVSLQYTLFFLKLVACHLKEKEKRYKRMGYRRPGPLKEVM